MKQIIVELLFLAGVCAIIIWGLDAASTEIVYLIIKE